MSVRTMMRSRNACLCVSYSATRVAMSNLTEIVARGDDLTPGAHARSNASGGVAGTHTTMAEKGMSHRAVGSRRAVRPGAPPTSPSTVTINVRQTVGIGKDKDKQNFTYKTDAGSTLYGFKMR